jgi:TrmH family RNA methyltransferase
MLNFTTLTERRRKEIASLQRRKGRDEQAQAIVEGWRNVYSAIEAGVPILDLVVSVDAAGDARLPDLVRRTGRPAASVPEHQFARLADTAASQGILAVVGTRYHPLAAVGQMPRILALDGIQDPGNVGTLLRTAGWFGIEAVVAGPATADFFQPKVIRSAMGGLWDVLVAECAELGDWLRALAASGYDTVGADLGGEPVAGWIPMSRTVLVLGSEAHGLSEGVRGALTRRVAIGGGDRRRGTESLNVAVAGGILLHRWASAG